MAVTWKTDFNPNELVTRIERIRKVSADGSVSFRGGFDFKLLDTLLYSMLNFPDTIPEIEGRNIARQSIFEAAKKGIITTQSLLSEVNSFEDKYIKRSIGRFVLTTSISIAQLTFLERVYVNRTQIIFENKLPREFIRDTANLRKAAENTIFGDPPNNYTVIRVHVSGKSHIEAANKALDDLDLIRGIWNLYENRRHLSRSSLGGKPKPVNKIILGPYHLLHFPTGKLASTSRWWYEPSYHGAIAPHRFINKTELFDYTSNIRSLLAKSGYRADMEVAIRRYARALDERDLNNAFIRLWSVLELLTDTIKQNYDQTIKRAAYIYEDYDFLRQILKQLRDCRNRTIHADAENSEMESFLYQLKNVIEDLIYFHLGNKFGFKSIQETGDFLSQPRTQEALKIRADMADYAMRFFGYKK